MKISLDTKLSNLIVITVEYSDAKDATVKEQLFKELLFLILDNKAACLITLTPQKYSFGYDVIPNFIRTIGRNSYLINPITNCNADLINAIVDSEEFRRTLLFVVKNEPEISNIQLTELSNINNNQSCKTKQNIIYCEDDGSSLYIYNDNADIADISRIVNSFSGYD